ncbi:adenylate kinase [candidate division TA06 bacterium]|uniref:Adenylate kinase n=1 Tax=candidate division TA06 bacterium TaxID=2250710 RepID=A0A933I8W0_UNCT6|nr:adenylate kinase [candidate division TA06 bacterium]
MRLVLLGAPGSGKGTQAKQICQKFNLPHISTGDILRQAVKDGSPLGLEAKGFMDRGELVPDHLILNLIKERFKSPDAQKGFLLDGFPRTVAQARGLEDMLLQQSLKIDLACSLDVEREELINRLTARRICPGCGAIYNLLFQSPPKENLCDKCNGKLEQRVDDQRQTVENRLEVYLRQTRPLLEYYDSRKLLKEINGNAGPDKVFQDISAVLQGI